MLSKREHSIIMKILCASDIHLGKRPVQFAVNFTEFTSADGWEALVDYAIESRTDVITLSGDVIDHANSYLEAFGPLERGLAKLATTGIDVVAVAGNHDWDVLPRLIERTTPKNLHLLGRDGIWESITLNRKGTVARFDGWSFPSQYYYDNPIKSYNIPYDNSIPTIGLLHGDLNVPGSRYAPFTDADLAGVPLSAWALGHIHKPILLQQNHGIGSFYAGSLQGLDPGETGIHGAWLIQVNSHSQIIPQHIALAPLRFDWLKVDVTGIIDEIAFQERISQALSKYGENLIPNLGNTPRTISIRISTSGRTKLHNMIDKFSEHLVGISEPYRVGDCILIIEKIIDNSVPDYNLVELAKMSNPPGHLAKLILSLEEGNQPDNINHFADDVIQKLRSVRDNRSFSSLQNHRLFDAPIDDGLAQDVIKREAYRLLNSLIEGRIA